MKGEASEIDFPEAEPPRFAKLRAIALGIVGTISEALRSCFVPPESIVLEFTEHAMLTDEEETSRCLNELAALGVGIALDDFGTGYSSLSYAKRFPVTSLKIDRSFVMDMEEDADARGISTAIIAMAHHLGLSVTAEGVETEFQENFLVENGCTSYRDIASAAPFPRTNCCRLS